MLIHRSLNLVKGKSVDIDLLVKKLDVFLVCCRECGYDEVHYYFKASYS